MKWPVEVTDKFRRLIQKSFGGFLELVWGLRNFQSFNFYQVKWVTVSPWMTVVFVRCCVNTFASPVDHLVIAVSWWVSLGPDCTMMLLWHVPPKVLHCYKPSLYPRSSTIEVLVCPATLLPKLPQANPIQVSQKPKDSLRVSVGLVVFFCFFF